MKSSVKIEKIIKSGQLSKMIDLEEDAYFEAKGGNPYNLETEKGRYELAKDVSAFANAEGGFLIIGLETKPLTEKNTDKVNGLDCIPKEKFDSKKYEGIIRKYIYPEISKLEVKWVENKDNSGNGIGCVWVPQQNLDRKFFLINKVVEKDEKDPIKQIVFGIAQRKGSSNEPLSIKDLHKKIQYGMNTIAQRLTGIENKIDSLIDKNYKAPSKETPTDKLEKRLADIYNSED
jgi:predicted HTH transcriptional regulator